MNPAALLPVLSLCLFVGTIQAKETEHHEEAEPVEAILFPFLALAVGMVTYRVLSRHAPWFPYTAAMFVLGTIMGVGAEKDDNTSLLHKSLTEFWLAIDPEVLLVAFLPGLIYHDAFSQDTHLFQVAFSQCLVFAFPMVLAGTTLTAMVAYYIFPYNWSFNLTMTFGSILAATDPVAVAALLDQVGAPPRLKVHIAGESLLNDGSAIVFFTIFSSLFFLELDVDEVGEDIDGLDGVLLFLQMSLGGACIGVFFGLGLLGILYTLHRRLESEENVVQVGATFTVAYLCYFTADVAWGTSGVIAVVALGVLVRAYGTSYMNDERLMESFWSIVEWLLNTILFTLGGLEWGAVISNEKDGLVFEARDWGNLFVLYLLLTAIRFGLFAVFFPVTSRIGLKSNWSELIFQSYGGLRGAVGISLAIVVDNTVKKYADDSHEVLFEQSHKLFGMVGGVAFLTLCVNGVFAGPLLRYLGLADLTDTRLRMLKCYRAHKRQRAITGFVELLGQRRFHKVSVAVVRRLVPDLKDMTQEELVEAACRVSAKEKAESFDEEAVETATVDDVSSYLEKIKDESKGETTATVLSSLRSSMAHNSIAKPTLKKSNNDEILHKASAMTMNELRRVFLEMLRAAYHKQIADGELVGRQFVVLSLMTSLDLAAESLEGENRLNDWDFLFFVGATGLELSKVAHAVRVWSHSHPCMNKTFAACCGTSQRLDPEITKARMQMEKCLAFIEAHSAAQEKLKTELSADFELGVLEERLVRESDAQIKKAEEFLKQFPPHEVEMTISHQVCKIILNKGVEYIEELTENGLLKEQEAGEFLEETRKSLRLIHSSDMKRDDSEEVGSTTSGSPAEQPAEQMERVEDEEDALATGSSVGEAEDTILEASARLSGRPGLGTEPSLFGAELFDTVAGEDVVNEVAADDDVAKTA